MTDPPALVRHARALATARAFGRAAGAQRVVLLVDQGEDAPAAMVEWELPDVARVTEGETTHELAGADARVRPVELPEIRAIPASTLELDPETGELAAPIGAVAHLAESVVALASAFGGRSVATADFPTRRPELPLTMAGRAGEPVVLAVGDQRFELPGA